MEVGGEAALALDGAEVLDLVAGAAAQVLDPPVEQLGEVQGVQGGAAVVVPGGVSRHARCPGTIGPYPGRVRVTNIEGR